MIINDRDFTFTPPPFSQAGFDAREAAKQAQAEARCHQRQIDAKKLSGALAKINAAPRRANEF